MVKAGLAGLWATTAVLGEPAKCRVRGGALWGLTAVPKPQGASCSWEEYEGHRWPGGGSGQPAPAECFWVSVRTATPGAALAYPSAEQPGVLRRKKVLCLPKVLRFCKSSIVKEDSLHPPPSRPCLWGPSQPCSASSRPSSPPQGARLKPPPQPSPEIPTNPSLLQVSQDWVSERSFSLAKVHLPILRVLRGS